MATEPGSGFPKRHRLALGIGASVAAVILLVLAYRATAPKSTQTTTATGEQVAESDVLRVGALPVT